MLQLALAGLAVGLVLDLVWWHTGIRKAEKGVEWHEHYHVGLECWIAEAFLGTGFLTGMGMGFFLAEWTQSTEIVGKKVLPGHPFAYGSSHFRSSTWFGAALAVVLAGVLVLT